MNRRGFFGRVLQLIGASVAAKVLPVEKHAVHITPLVVKEGFFDAPKVSSIRILNWARIDWALAEYSKSADVYSRMSEGMD